MRKTGNPIHNVLTCEHSWHEMGVIAKFAYDRTHLLIVFAV